MNTPPRGARAAGLSKNELLRERIAIQRRIKAINEALHHMVMAPVVLPVKTRRSAM